MRKEEKPTRLHLNHRLPLPPPQIPHLDLTIPPPCRQQLLLVLLIGLQRSDSLAVALRRYHRDTTEVRCIKHTQGVIRGDGGEGGSRRCGRDGVDVVFRREGQG